MTSENINLTEQLSPQFEGFFLKTSICKNSQELEERLDHHFSLELEVQPIDSQSTSFDVGNQNLNLTAHEAWKLTYQIRELQDIAYVEPLFAISIDGRPDWTEEIVLPDEEQGVETFIQRIASGSGSTEDLPESDDFEWALTEMKVFEAWERFFPDWETTPPGQGIIIGHPDTGYRLHPEIEDNLLLDKGYDFIDQDLDPLDTLEKPLGVLIPNPGHGTAAASVIVSPKGGASEPYITGVAPGATLIPYRTSSSVVLFRQSVKNLAQSIERAVQDGADIISASMGAVKPSRRLKEAVLQAQAQGVIVLGAAGNIVPWVVPPASIDEVIAVAGSNAKREIWTGSSFGKQVDVTAPGESVWMARATKDDDGQVSFGVVRGSGTTFAVALTAGVAALWLAHHGGRKAIAQQLGGDDYLGQIPVLFKQILKKNCTSVPTWDPTKYGQGLVNAEDTIAANIEDYVDSVSMSDHSISEFNVGAEDILNEFQVLFEQALPQVSPDISVSSEEGLTDKLTLQLSNLLNTSPKNLPEKLLDVGEELLFNFAVNPDSYKAFRRSLSESTFSSNRDEQSLLTKDNFDDIRALLVSKGLSSKLRAQISRR